MKLRIYIIKIISLNVFLLVSVLPVFAMYDDYCKQQDLGWHFYCDKPAEENKTQQNMNNSNKVISYSEKVQQIQKIVDEVKAKAVLEPTEQNIKNYLTVQLAVLNQSSVFSDVWRRTLWKTPDLDYLQQRPMNSQAKTIFDSEQRISEESNMKMINKRYGIFFIYLSTCPYCHRYAEILVNIKKEFNLNIIGISLDGKFLSKWGNDSKVYNGELKDTGVEFKTVPITLLYDNTQKHIVVVGYGLMTRDELISRIYVLTNKKIGEDY